MKLLVGTLVMECIRMRNTDGVVVAGGAGVGGDSNAAAARKGMVDRVTLVWEALAQRAE